METHFDSPSLEGSARDKEIDVRVIGVGGGGGNAINNMIEKGVYGGVEFIAVDTDQQMLTKSRAPQRIQSGKNLTKGLGAGARPSVGAEAIEENRSEIEKALRGADLVFVVAGLGGGTGTGGAPVVASIARKLDILTVAVVTLPFDAEGSRRKRTAREGVTLLKEHVDTLIVIPSERLLDIADDSTSLMEAFAIADDALYDVVRGISDLITVHGLINLDFADVQMTMRDGGAALAVVGYAEGPNRAEEAVLSALRSPLLDGLSINGARNVLVNITSGPNLGIREATKATSIIQREAGEDVEVIFGTVIDEDLGDGLRVTIIATRFSQSITERLLTSPERWLTSPARKERGAEIPLTDPLRETGLDLYLDLGGASEEDIIELYSALSELHRAYGGTGVVVRDDGQLTLTGSVDHSL